MNIIYVHIFWKPENIRLFITVKCIVLFILIGFKSISNMISVLIRNGRNISKSSFPH